MLKLKLSCVLLCLIKLSWSAEFQGGPLQIEFFTFSAPEEEFRQKPQALEHLAASSKRHQQVIFIKNPENRVHHNAMPNLAQSASEQKTHIYVLTKEPSHKAAKQQLQQSHQYTHHKPEVRFLNYRHPGEAEKIQAQIIQQYGGRF